MTTIKSSFNFGAPFEQKQNFTREKENETEKSLKESLKNAKKDSKGRFPCFPINSQHP